MNKGVELNKEKKSQKPTTSTIEVEPATDKGVATIKQLREGKKKPLKSS